MKWMRAYEHDFNTGHREFLEHKDHDLKIGDSVMLVTIEGPISPEYEGFGCVVTVAGFRPAHDPDYVRVLTDDK